MMLQIMDKCNQAPDKVLCITDHPGFQSVALCPWNLQAVYNGYRQLYDNMPEKSLVLKSGIQVTDSYTNAPLYLCELCKPCTDSRLRSKSRGDFITPRTRLRFTDRAFAVSAPSAWNSLPIDIRDCSSEATFKKHLKIFLFHVAFN